MIDRRALAQFGEQAEELNSQFLPSSDGREIKALLGEMLTYLSAHLDAGWRQYPSPGVRGSLSQTNSRRYRLSLNGSYEAEVTWRDYPDDVVGCVPESFRESYTLQIESTGKDFFPLVYLEVRQSDEKREFQPRNRQEEELLALGRQLRERIG